MLKSVVHALSYPFPAPEHSFVYEKGGWRGLQISDFDLKQRIPVLAAGSNQSPEQLIRKYADYPEFGPIPAQRGQLFDFDVVYAAHLTGYGSIPATFQRSKGTIVTVFLLWLTERQLTRMHETEGNYTYDRLPNLKLILDEGGKFSESAYAYSAKYGCYNYGGNCVSLQQIFAKKRKFPAFTQAQALETVRDQLIAGVKLEFFVEQLITKPTKRLNFAKKLRKRAIAAKYKRETILVL